MAPWGNRKSLAQVLLDYGTAFLFEYETPRVVTLRSYRVGLIYRSVQLCLIAYLIGYVFVYTKSYQDFDTAESSVVTKIKGILHRTVDGKKEIWDGVDFVVPPQESGAFFIATSVLYTANQSQSACPEDANVGKKGIHCLRDEDCEEGEVTPYGNGLKTGRCVEWDNTTTTCEILGWCPTEADRTPKEPVLSGFDTLTVLVKHHVAFAKYGVKRRNILESFNQSYLRTCRFHPDTDPLCPIFHVMDIVEFAKENFSRIAISGGIIGFNIDWNCDLDLDLELCVPRYSFKRLDNKDDKIGKGWNFRHAYYHYDPSGQLRRDLVKLWGIRFVFNVNGLAGKFSAVNFAMNFGSGLGLLGIASIVCEFVLLNCMHHKTGLLAQKFTTLTRAPSQPVQANSSRQINHMYLNGSNETQILHAHHPYEIRVPHIDEEV